MAYAELESGPRFRARAWLPEGAAAAAVSAASVILLAANEGGFFAPAWGWSAVLLFWVAGVAAVSCRTGPTPAQWVALGGMAALVAWTFASISWSPARADSVLEAERSLVYLAALGSLILTLRRGGVALLVSALAAAIVIVDAYGLATRLFPDRLGVFHDPLSGGRLYEPIGYWNALGAFSAMGTLLLIGILAGSGHRRLRAAAAASLLVTVPTIYFTFSRGAMAAAVIGYLAVVLVAPRRLRLLFLTLLVSPWVGLGILAAWRATALNTAQVDASAASHAGVRLAAILAGCALAAALTVAGAAALERRLVVSPRLRRAFASLVVAALVASAGIAIAHYGSPLSMAERVRNGLEVTAPSGGPTLNSRLGSLSLNGRLELWRAAWEQALAHPARGAGAGSFGRYWLVHRPDGQFVVDAHNLYLETLSELGAVGLLALLVVLAAPLAAALRQRSSPLTAPLLGAFVVYLAHAAVDWDWEMPALTVTALACAAGLLALGANHPPRLGLRIRTIVAVVAVAGSAFALVGFVSNSALDRSAAAARSGNWREAVSEARTATRWAPWSYQGRQALAEAHAGQGRDALAARDYREALAKDDGDWELWYGLAQVTDGSARRRALARARLLDPRAPELSPPARSSSARP